MIKEKIYQFKGIKGLYADIKGNFFFNNKQVPTVYNNGSLAVRVGKTKYGIIKLRTLAYVSYKDKDIDELPF